MLWKKVKLDEWIRVWLQSQIYDYRWIQIDKNDVALYVYVGSEPTFLCFELKYAERYRDVHVSLIKYNDENALQNELANMWYTNFNRKSPLHFLSAKHSISFDVFRVVADSCTNGKLDIPKGYEDLEDYVFTMME